MEHPGSDPIELLVAWHAEALALGAADPDAMALGTATRDGIPSVRVVLFKGVQDGRIRFVTNAQSRKAREIQDNPRVALSFYWPDLKRHVRIEGTAVRGTRAESESYFVARPRESQLGAWASAQSQPVPSREVLEQRYRAAEERFRGRPVELPDYWAAYWVEPSQIELWLFGDHRLHDRFCYRRSETGWSVTRLCP